MKNIVTGVSLKKIARKQLPYLLILPSLLILTVILVWPSIYNLWLSLWRIRLTNPDQTTFVGLRNYIEMVQDPLFWIAWQNTFVFVVTAVFLEFIIGFFCALILAQQSDLVRRIIGSILILPYMIAGSVVGLIWRLMWTYEYGLVNYALNLLGLPSIRWLGDISLAMISVIITEVWRNTPFVTLVLLAGLMAIPREIYESARVDGANLWQRFRRLTLPLLSPSITIALLFRTIFAIRVFDVIYTLTRGGPGTATMPVGILLYNQTFRFFQVGSSAALALVILFVGMVISSFYLRVIYRRIDY